MTSRIACGLSWTTASAIIRNIVGLLQIAILTRYLDKSDFGIVAIAQLFIGFTTMFLDMGISIGIIHKSIVTNNEYSSLFWLNILLGIILTAGLFLFAPFFTASYNSPDLTYIVQLICVTIFINSLGIQQKTYCQKKALFSRIALIDIIGSILTIIVAVTTAVLGYGVYCLAYSILAGSIFINLTHLFIGLIKDCRLHLHFSLSETLPFLKIGIYQVGASILDFLTRELDIFILSTTLGLEFLGVYNIAKRIPSAVYSFIQPIVSMVFTPFLAERKENQEVLRSDYMRISKSLSWISFPIYFLLAALSPTVIAFIFGLNYLDGVPVMAVFCLRYAFNGVNGVCGALQTATGRTDIGLKWTIYLILSTALVYYTTSYRGIATFLIGICLLTLINALMVWLMQFKPMVNVKFFEYISIYTKSFLVSLILALFVYVLNPNPSLLYSCVSSLFFVPIFIFVLMSGKEGNEVLCVLKILNFPIKIINVLTKVYSYKLIK